MRLSRFPVCQISLKVLARDRADCEPLAPTCPQCISAEAGQGRWRWTEAVSRKTTNRAPRSAPCGRLPPHAGKPDTGGQYAECLLRLLQRLPGGE